MKSRKLIIALAAFSSVLILIDGGHHLLQAKTGKLLLSIMKPDDPQFESMEEAVHHHYESLGSAAAAVAALGFLIFIVARNKYAPNAIT